MNTLRILSLVTVAGLIGAGAGARAEEKKADYAKLIVGKWEVTKADDAAGVPVGASIEFTKDGKMKMTAEINGEKRTFEATYKVSGDKFTMTMKRGEEERSQDINIKKLDAKMLSTTSTDGKVVELTRKSD